MPTLDTLRSQKLINDKDQVCQDIMYTSFYAGDYDSAAWLHNKFLNNFNNSYRGKVPIGWAVDPSLSERFPLIFDYIFSNISPNDRIISGDSGAAYLNPAYLLKPLRNSSLPSASNLWTQFCSKYFERFSLNFTGFIINGWKPMTPEAEQMYCKFSTGGVVEQRSPEWDLRFICDGQTPVFFEIDLPPTVNDAISQILNAKQSLKQPAFLVFRTILQNAEYHYQVASGVQDKGIIFVDPLELSLLAKTYKDKGSGEC